MEITAIMISFPLILRIVTWIPCAIFMGCYLQKILVFDRDKLNQNDQISYDIFLREMKMNLEGIDLHFAINNVCDAQYPVYAF